jgi:hypothetical protein
MLIKIGSFYFFTGDLSNGEIFINESLEIYSQSNYIHGIVSSLSNIGEIKALRGLLYESHDFYQRALSFTDKLNDEKITSELMQNIAFIYF